MNENTTYELFPVYVKKLGRVVNYVNCHIKEKGFLSAEKEAAVAKDSCEGINVEELDVEELDCRMDHLFVRTMEKCDPGYWAEMIEKWNRIGQIYDGLPDRFGTLNGHVYDRKAEEFRRLLLEYLGKTYSGPVNHLIGIIGTTAASLGYSREVAHRLINFFVPPKTITNVETSERRPE